MINFFKTIIQACYSRKFYLDSLNDSFFRRFFILLFIQILIFGGFTAFGLLKLNENQSVINKSFETLVSYADQTLPAELEFTIQKGEFSMNQVSPYTIQPEWAQSTQPPEFKIVIDENAKVENYDQIGATVLITRTGIMSKKDKTGEIKFIQFKDMLGDKTFVFNHKIYESFKASILPKAEQVRDKLVVILSIFAAIMLPIICVFLCLVLAVILLFYSIPGWIVCLISRKKLNYTEIYLSSMYLIIPLTILRLALPQLITGTILFLVYLALLVILLPKKINFVQNT